MLEQNKTEVENRCILCRMTRIWFMVSLMAMVLNALWRSEQKPTRTTRTTFSEVSLLAFVHF